MALLDYFSKASTLARRKDKAKKKITNMYYQQADRLATADLLFEFAESGDVDGVHILLARFEHLCPSTTVDREEKDYVVKLLIALGEMVVEPIQQYCLNRTKPTYWPLLVLQGLWPKATLSDFIGEILEGLDNDYWRDPEKKVGLMDIAAAHDTDRVTNALIPFVEDHHEDIRYASAATLLARDIDLSELIAERIDGGEESLRVRVLLARGFAKKGWVLGERAKSVADNPPQGFKVLNGKLIASS
jgi:hypothetical protein